MSSRTPRLQVNTLRTHQPAQPRPAAPVERPPSLVCNSNSEGDDSSLAGTPPDRTRGMDGLDMKSLKKALLNEANSAAPRTRTRYKQLKDMPLFLSEPFVSNALVQGKFKIIAQCPSEVDRNEWIAVNLVDFFMQINNWYSLIFSLCKCPTMSVSPDFDLFWRDQRQRPAFTYCDSTLSWVEDLTKNRTVFPTEQGREFAPEFPTIAHRIYNQLLMLFAHAYHAHFAELVHLEAESHFNSLTAHYITFGLSNGLLAPDAREINPASRKGATLGHLVRKWQTLGIISESLLAPYPG